MLPTEVGGHGGGCQTRGSRLLPGMMLGGGCGQQLASWIVHGRPEKDMHSYDIRQVPAGPVGGRWLPWNGEAAVMAQSLSRVQLWRPTGCSPPGSSVHGFSRQEYWSGCHFLLQGFFPTQGLNLGLLHCRQILYRLSYKGSF